MQLELHSRAYMIPSYPLVPLARALLLGFKSELNSRLLKVYLEIRPRTPNTKLALEKLCARAPIPNYRNRVFSVQLGLFSQMPVLGPAVSCEVFLVNQFPASGISFVARDPRGLHLH